MASNLGLESGRTYDAQIRADVLLQELLESDVVRKVETKDVLVRPCTPHTPPTRPHARFESEAWPGG